jgi:hypothetical protein
MRKRVLSEILESVRFPVARGLDVSMEGLDVSMEGLDVI